MPNKDRPIKLCQYCILPQTFPGIKFNDQGICNHCQRAESARKKASEKKSEYRERLGQLIDSLKGSAPTYDAVMAYSGGKDSSYAMKLLRERYDLKILALTFDNHFVSPFAWENINKITDKLQIDQVRVRPPWPIMKQLFSIAAIKDIFPAPTLLRASSICTACIGLVKSIALKTSLEMSIPLVAFGWSPGQAPIQSAIMKTNPSLIHQNQVAFKKALRAEISNEIERYFIPEIYFETYKNSFPTNIHPLAFFNYDEEKFKIELEELGWKAPTDTDTNSSNCLLNALANQYHIKRHHFHPYAWEIANMVRQGVMRKDEGIEKIFTEQNKEMVEYARKKLELKE